MPTPLPQSKEAKDDEPCSGVHTRGRGSHACARGCACKLRRRWGAGGSSAGRGSSSVGNATTSGKSSTGGPSGGGGKYGSSSSAATTTTNRASGGTLKTIVIKETDFKLSSSTVTLSKPGTYAFKAENKGSAEHSLEIDGKGVKSSGGKVGEAKLEQNIDSGESGVLTVTFQERGTYEIYCPVIGHRLAGMKGTVVIK